METAMKRFNRGRKNADIEAMRLQINREVASFGLVRTIPTTYDGPFNGMVTAAWFPRWSRDLAAQEGWS
jgi:hypothetical protein